MKILLTAGGTSTRIDRGRTLTCVAPARGAARYAHAFWSRGHDLTVLTSSADTLAELPANQAGRVSLLGYETVDDLLALFPQVLQSVAPDVVLHTAAVSEYKAAGVFTPAPGTTFHTRVRRWDSAAGPPELLPLDPFIDQPPDEQWVRLSRGPRVIERVRPQWKFTGLLAVARVEPEMPDGKLIEAAEAARGGAFADLMTVTTDADPPWAFLGPVNGRYDRVMRRELPERLVSAVEEMHRARADRG